MKRSPHTSAFIAAVSPTLAQAAGEAATTQLQQLGVKPQRPARKGELTDYFPEGEVPSYLTMDLPEWMVNRIDDLLTYSFDQSYWDDITATTKEDIKVAISLGLEDGKSIREIASEIDDLLGDEEYYHNRALNIARTEAGNALNGGRKAAIDGLLEEIPELAMRPVWRSVLGTTTRESHANLDGVPADEDGLWELGGVRVPWPGHYNLPAEERCNCFPGTVLISGSFTGAQRAWYEGTVTKIVTENGAVLTLTPNHPVMTSQGWVRACCLQPGQEVLTYQSQVDLSSGLSETSFDLSSTGNDIENKPVPIEKIFRAFLTGSIMCPESSIVKVVNPDMGDHFYGDAKLMQGYIQVIGTNWKLLGDFVSGCFEKQGDTVFICPDMGLEIEPSNCSFSLSNGGIFSTSSTIPRSTKSLLDIAWGLKVSPSGSLTVGMAPNWNTQLLESPFQGRTGNSAFLGEALQRSPLSVSLSKIVEVSYHEFSGHVYDLSSDDGLIIASDNPDVNIGIVTSNCQCSVTIEYGMEQEEAQALIEDYNLRYQEYQESRKPRRKRSYEKHLSGQHDQSTHGRGSRSAPKDWTDDDFPPERLSGKEAWEWFKKQDPWRAKKIEQIAAGQKRLAEFSEGKIDPWSQREYGDPAYREEVPPWNDDVYGDEPWKMLYFSRDEGEEHGSFSPKALADQIDQDVAVWDKSLLSVWSEGWEHTPQGKEALLLEATKRRVSGEDYGMIITSQARRMYDGASLEEAYRDSDASLNQRAGSTRYHPARDLAAAKVLLDTMRSPPDSYEKELYRGADSEVDKVKPGDELVLAMGSASKDQNRAKTWGKNLIVWSGGAAGLDIDARGRSILSEREFLLSGKWRVDSVEEQPNGGKVIRVGSRMKAARRRIAWWRLDPSDADIRREWPFASTQNTFEGTQKLRPAAAKRGYDPRQPRDDHGRWSSGGFSLPEVGEEVRIEGSKYWAEPTDSDDSFPPAVARYELKGGYVFYTGRNGSEGVVTGTREQVERWMRDVLEEVRRNPPEDQIARPWTSVDGGQEKIQAAVEAANKVASLFNTPPKEVEFSVAKRPLELGSHGNPLRVINAHTDDKYKTWVDSVPQGVHVAAHEMMHTVYSQHLDRAQQAMKQLQESGQHVSLYGQIAGAAEGLMELGAVYSYAPDKLKSEYPHLYEIIDSFARDVSHGQKQVIARVEKHLPGRHDQSTHGHGRVTAGEVLSSRQITITDALDVGDTLIASRKNLTPLEEQGIVAYTHNETGVFRKLNRELREGKITPDDLPEDIKSLNELAKSELPQPPPVHIYRGIDPYAYKGIFGEGGAQIGDEIECNSMVSTSLAPEIAIDYSYGNKVVLEVKAKRGVPVQDRSKHVYECEIVQAYGTKYRVVGIEESDFHIRGPAATLPDIKASRVTVIRVEEI